MTNEKKQTFPLHTEKGKNGKKLRKREKRLEERLSTARAALTNAEERLHRAEERVSKNKGRVQRLEERFMHLRLAQEEAPTAFIPSDKKPLAAERVIVTVIVSEERPDIPGELLLEQAEQEQPEAFASLVTAVDYLQDSQQDFALNAVNSQSEIIANAETIERARMAREVAQAAEEGARQAIERVYALMEHLEEVGHSRHLVEDLAQSQSEADNAKQRALVAEQQALLVEHEAGLTFIEYSVQAETSSTIGIPTENGGQQESTIVQGTSSLPLQSLLSAEEEERVAALHDDEQDIVRVSSLLSREESFSKMFANAGEREMPKALLPASIAWRELAPEGTTSVKEIEEEEASVEAVTALIIADAAAAAAAEAEALAEASSSRTREACLNAQQADEAVVQIRTAIEHGVLDGDEAESALRSAEQQATHAHAALADAEATEERARRVAMDAEAEAEVAEGMAFATDERGEMQGSV